MFKLFQNKKQETVVKSFPILESEVVKTTSLKLTKVMIEYNASYVRPYQAKIGYAERPDNWTDQGVCDEVNIIGDDWPDLLNKVASHFKPGAGLSTQLSKGDDNG